MFFNIFNSYFLHKFYRLVKCNNLCSCHCASFIFVGFIGVLIVSRPGTIHFTFSLFLLFIGAIILAVNVLLIRMYATNQSSIAFAFYGFVSGLVLSSFLVYNNYVPLKGSDIYVFIFRWWVSAHSLGLVLFFKLGFN